MSTPRKPRSDSPLRTLPEERQAEIIELCKKMGYVEVRAELRKDGFTVSTGALSDFFSWWHLRQQFAQNRSDINTVLEELKKSNADLTPEQIFAHGQQLFSLLAMKNQDAESWSWIQKARQKEEELKIERKKFNRETCRLFIEWVADEEAKKIATSSVNHEEKLQELGRKMFGEDWE